MSMSIEHQHRHEQSDDTMTIRVTPYSAALVSSQGASSCLRGAGCVNCHESSHRLSYNRGPCHDGQYGASLKLPYVAPGCYCHLLRRTKLSCSSLASMAGGAIHAAISLPLNIPESCKSCSCQSIVPVRWKDAQQGISGSIISRHGGRLASLYHYFAQWTHSCFDCRLLNGPVSS